MSVRAAQIISYVFHPLLLTTYLVLLLGQVAPTLLLVRQDQFLTFTAFIFGITFLLPAINIVIFRQFGVIDSLHMLSRRERILPLIFNSILYVLIACLFIFRLHLSTNFTKLILIVACLAVIAAVFTIFFKVSIHSLAWAGLLGILVPLNRTIPGGLLIPTVVMILITGLVMSARLRLNAHTPFEVMVGGLSGFAVGFVGMSVLF